MKICFLGTPTFATPILEALNEKYEICLVVTKVDQVVKKKVVYSPVKQKALELGLKVITPTNLKEVASDIINCGADVLITAAYGMFIPSLILNKFKYKINVHGSLLPKRRGGAPIQRSLIEGDKLTGITIMEMAPKMDSGKIYAKKEYEILDSDNNTSLFEKLSLIGRDLLLETLPAIVDGTIKGTPQNEEEATFSYNLTKEDELIDFNKDARSVFNQIRGLSLEPGAYFNFQNEIFKVYESKVVEDNSNAIPGTILSTNKKLVIKCGKDAISILVIKVQSKKMMDVKSFLNGQKYFKEGLIIN